MQDYWLMASASNRSHARHRCQNCDRLWPPSARREWAGESVIVNLCWFERQPITRVRLRVRVEVQVARAALSFCLVNNIVTLCRSTFHSNIFIKDAFLCWNLYGCPQNNSTSQRKLNKNKRRSAPCRRPPSCIFICLYLYL